MPDVIALTAEQMRLVTESSSSINIEHLLATGSLEERMLILVDIERLTTGPEMGLILETTH